MDKRVVRAIELMREKPDRGFSPDELAQAVNLSPSRLHQLFKHETGTSPAKYLKALRLERARELLETSFLSVKEIRARVGEGDESHFTRAFKRAFGVTPTQYKARRNGAHGAASVGSPCESHVPAHPSPGSERARPGPASGRPSDQGAAAKALQLLLRVSARRAPAPRTRPKTGRGYRPARRAAQRPAGEWPGTPPMLRPAPSFEATRGRRVNWPHYRKLSRIRLVPGRPPSFRPAASRPPSGQQGPLENSLPPIP